MIDLAMLITLQTRWKELSLDAVAFKALLPSYIEDSLKQQWFDYLVPSGNANFVQFAPAYNVDTAKVPQVIAHQEDEPLEQQPLNFLGRIEALTPVHEMLVSSTVHLTMYCANPDALRALYEVVRGIMLASVGRMLAAGFVSVRYIGGGDIMPEPGLLPDELGVMMRLQKWQVVTNVEALDAAGPGEHKSVFVHASDITVNGKQGGVTPEE